MSCASRSDGASGFTGRKRPWGGDGGRVALPRRRAACWRGDTRAFNLSMVVVCCRDGVQQRRDHPASSSSAQRTFVMAFVSTGARLPCTLSVPYAPSSQTWRTSLFVVETTGCMALVSARVAVCARGCGGLPILRVVASQVAHARLAASRCRTGPQPLRASLRQKRPRFGARARTLSSASSRCRGTLASFPTARCAALLERVPRACCDTVPHRRESRLLPVATVLM